MRVLAGCISNVYDRILTSKPFLLVFAYSGIAVFLLPAVVMELPNSLGGILSLGSRSLMGESSLFMRYCGLALVNGLAFASYK